MIIYGSNSKNLRSANPKNLKCPNCAAEGSTSINILNHYAHVFWVPLFPLGRKMVSQCDNCQHVLKRKQMPADFDMDARTLMAETRIPLWSFSGLALLAVFALWIVYSGNQKEKATAEYFAAPIENDVYNITTEGGNYSTMKLIAVDADSVTVTFNLYEIDKRSKVDELDKAENYEEEYYRIARSLLVEMYEAKEIFSISRE